MDNWENIPLDEQESVLNVDYNTRQVDIYTSRKTTANKLLKRFKDTSKITYYRHNGNITGVRITKSFYDKDITRLFSKMLILSNLQPR